MNEDTITLAEVLYRIGRGERFSINFVKADRRKGTGGEIVRMENCISNHARKRGKKRGDGMELVDLDRDPNHYQNSTRNIYSLKDKKIFKVHIRLITRFNGAFVL